MLIPVVLSGGAGSRLWPVSREARPKPFIRLADGESLLQKAAQRAAALDGVSHVVTVTNKDYFFLTKEEYERCAPGAQHCYLLEPSARNTAPAIAMAALYCAERFGADAELLILPADHLIGDAAQFAAAVRAARVLAARGPLVTFGILPTRPETGYGYIECGEPIADAGYRVQRFVEKPPLDRAQEFLKSDRFLWNSGMFCFRAASFLAALRDCHPALYEAAQRCWRVTARSDPAKIDLPGEAYATLPDISIDYAVMEKHRDVAVVKATFDWNDIGSWTALGELSAPDAAGNRLVGETITVDARDCYIQSDSRVVAAVGVKDLIVVDTPDALLIADRDRAQDVKQVVAQLKLANHTAHELHRTVNRPWGTYTVLEEGPRYKLKRIVVKPGASLSLQMHRHRSEHWVVLSGVAVVTNDTRRYTVQANESTFIPAGNRHRLENTGTEDLAIIEVQVGDYVGEDDIVRFDDVYGRA